MTKKVYHESGTYYLKHSQKKKKYLLFKSRMALFFGDSFEETDDNRFDKQEMLLRWVKAELNEVSREKMIRKSKSDMIKTWDGYTSDAIKRDKKIDKII